MAKLELRDFITAHRIEVPNVAGPRAIKEPGVYDFTLDLLRWYWQQQQRQKPPL
jgi:hypothetical protein